MLVDSIAIQMPKSVTADLSGRLYFSISQGAIVQYSAAGDSLRAFQPSGQEPPQLFTWQMLRIQAYFPFQQSLIIIDQNLNEVSQFILPETILGNAFLSSDQQIWYVNSESMLIKYNPVLDQTALSTSLQWYIDPTSSILYLQEYQNRLYIQTSQRMLIMDLYGNYLSKLSLETENRARFVQDKMYYVDNGQIKVIGLYDGKLEALTIPISRTPAHLLLTDNLLHVVSDDYWYRFQKQTSP
jgi:hypothetical protein